MKCDAFTALQHIRPEPVSLRRQVMQHLHNVVSFDMVFHSVVSVYIYLEIISLGEFLSFGHHFLSCCVANSNVMKIPEDVVDTSSCFFRDASSS